MFPSPSPIAPLVELVVVLLVLATAVAYLVRRALRRNDTACATSRCAGCELACTRSPTQTLRTRPNGR